MAVSNFSKAKAIPSKLSTRKSAPTTTNFAKGIYTYKPNDTMGLDEVYLAQNARFDRIGEYKTRRGLKALNEPYSKTKVEDSYSESYDMVNVEDVSLQINTLTLPVYSIFLTVSAVNNTDYGVLELDLLDSDGNVVARSCAQNLTTYPEDTEFVFKDGPIGIFTAKLHTQGSSPQKFKVACTTGTTTPMYKQYTAIAGKVISVFEANIEGEKTIVYVAQTSSSTMLFKLNQDNSSTLIRSPLPSGVERVRFQQNLDQIRYADGKEGPRLVKPLSSWTDTAITTTDLESGTDLGIKVSNIMHGIPADIVYFDAETTTQAVWTWPYNYRYNGSPIASYDKFDRNGMDNFPAIKTGDPLTAMFNLGGIAYFLTRKNKYSIYYQTTRVWTQQASSAQHGTFSQESTVCDLNYAYYANDDGIYMFDGSSEMSLTEKTIQSTYDSIPNKESMVLDLYNNRLYAFYSSNGDGVNDSCLVYNINLRLWESFDTGTCVASTCARKSPSNRFICGSSKFIQLYVYEDETADYADLGAPIDFDLETSYMHFGTPSQKHRITKWRPEFATVDGNYSIQCGYALDFTDNVKYAFSVNLKDNTIIQENYVWDNPPDYGNTVRPTVLSTIPQVNGQFYRCQVRYQKHAAFEPVNFKSHTMSVETQRLR